MLEHCDGMSGQISIQRFFILDVLIILKNYEINRRINYLFLLHLHNLVIRAPQELGFENDKRNGL